MNIEPSKKVILAVDDTPANIDVVKGILSEDYFVQAAVNGKMALKIIEKKKPDLILLDIMMPDMDGYEVCRLLKADDNTCKIPIIFLTAMTDSQDEAKGLALGAVDYITKPISPPVLMARVYTHLALRTSYLKLDAAKQELDATHQHIMQSINYAQRIQQSILPSPELLNSFMPQHFIVWKPRDVVGGDLYWCKPWGDGEF